VAQPLAYLIASLAKLALLNGSLRSLRWSREAAGFVESDETTIPIIRSVLIRFVGYSCRSAARTSRARIAPSSSLTSSSLADDKTCLLPPPQHSEGAI
jgi:hypothetical protein